MKLQKKKSIFFLILFILPILFPLSGFSLINSTQIKKIGGLINENQYSKTKDVPNTIPKASTLPSFTANSMTNNRITAYNITTINIHTFFPSRISPDVLIGTQSDGFYLYPGPINPFSYSSWSSGFALNTSVSSPIKALYAMPIDGNQKISASIYADNGQGDQFYFHQSNDISKMDYTTASDWEDVNQGNQASSYIYGNDTLCSAQAELGGEYNLNDEVVLGLNTGALVYVETQNVAYNNINNKFIENLICDNITTNGVRNVAVGDLNNDGHNDVVADFYGTGIYAFENDGNPSAGPWHYQLISSLPSVSSIALGDINDDGKLDIIAGCDNGSVYALENNGNPFGNSFNKSLIGNFGTNAKINDIAVGDLDLDGDLDVVCALQNGSIAVMENPLHMPVGETESSPFSGIWASSILSTVNSNIGATNVVKVVDMNNDGKLDIVAGYSSGWVYLYKNNLPSPIPISAFKFGPSTTIGNTTTTNFNYNQMATGDLDNDGTIDLVVSSQGSNGQNATITIYKNPGYTTLKNYSIQNTWEKFTVYSQKNAQILGIKLVDLDKNGYLDIVFDENGTSVLALKNNGNPWENGSWQGPYTLLNNPQSYDSNLLITNLENDQSKEIIWASSWGTTEGTIMIYMQQSNPWLSWNNEYIIANDSNGQPITNVVTGYFDSDNWKDLIYSDLNQTFAKEGAANIGSLPGSSVVNIWNATSGNYINAMTKTEFSGDKVSDILLSCQGSDNNIQGLENPNNQLPSFSNWGWSYRATSNIFINGLRSVDLNKDGMMDCVFWNNTAFWVAQGNDKPSVNMTTYKIDQFSGQTIEDIQCGDFDQDGDIDIMVVTNNQILYFANRIGDSLTSPQLTLNFDKKYSPNWVNITVTSDEQLVAPPTISINNGISTLNEIMNPTGNSLQWCYNYTIQRNGTNYVTVTSYDLYGNKGKVQGVCYGYKILPQLNLKLLGPYVEGYSNHTITIIVTNTTNIVGDNKIGLNITTPSNYTTYYYASYNQTANNFQYVYNDVDIAGTYTVGVNATNQYLVDYTYAEKTFQGDLTPPNIIAISQPKNGTGSFYDTNQNLPFNATFDEKIIAMRWYVWTTNKGILDHGLFNQIIDSNGTTSVNFTYNLVRGLQGEMNLTVVYIDLAGNINTFTQNISIVIYPPIYCNFDFVNYDTGEQGITNTTDYLVRIQMQSINCTEVLIKIGDGNWSSPIPFVNNMVHTINLGTVGGNINVTVRFQNPEAYVDVSHTILYTPRTVPGFPWYYFVLGAIGVGLVLVIVSLVKKRKERGGKDWKKYLDADI